MSWFSRVGRSNALELSNRGYEPLGNGQDRSPGDPRRKAAQTKTWLRGKLWIFVPLILLLVFVYIKMRHTISHHATAVRCRIAVATTTFHETAPRNVTNERTWAKRISAEELMRRLDRGELTGTKILHQSWKRDVLEGDFKTWSQEWRSMHGEDWIYVLWTDADNAKLVQRYYPEFVDTYNNLKAEIYRADMARNMYMHRFGGIYADLDLIPLQPIPHFLPVLAASSPPPIHIAYLGRMSDASFEHSIPNAFMASTPAGHPFWLKPMEYIRRHMDSRKYNYQPEALTGPVALRNCVNDWENDKVARHGEANFDEVVVLDHGKIYPFSWWDAKFVDQCVCRPQSAVFDPLKCNSLYRDSWTITYWAHSWEDYSCISASGTYNEPMYAPYLSRAAVVLSKPGHWWAKMDLGRRMVIHYQASGSVEYL